MFLYHFITGPCENVHIELPSDAKVPGIAGTYKLRSGGKTNGRQDWMSSNGKFAMWYGKSGFWFVGLVEQRGTQNVIMYTAETTLSSPVEVGAKWIYGKSTGGISNPTDAVKVTCKQGK